MRAGGWSLASHVVGQGLRFATNLVMTRLLVPEMFGLMAIANMVMIGLALMSDLGLRQSVVQSPRGGEPSFLNTVWIVQILRGIGICALAALAALMLRLAAYLGMASPGSVYADPSLPLVIATLGLGAAVSGFDSTRALEASRRLALGRITQIELLAQCVGILAMVVLATVEHSVWVLVGGSLASSAARTVLTHAWLPGVPNRLRWERGHAREILHFGKWVFLSSVLTYFGSASDMMMLGALVSAPVLGVYSIAILLLNAAEQIVMRLTGDVAFPALSEVARDRPQDLRQTFYRFHFGMAAFSFACSGLFAAAAPSIVHRLYDPRYADAGWMLQILAVGLIAVPCRLHAMSLLALGQAREHAVFVAVRLAAILVSVPLGFHLGGMFGVVWGIALSYLTYLPSAFLLSRRNGLLDLRREVLPLPTVAGGWLVGLVAARLLG
jgi:O-antigen/teichoic acid export membrane protein